MSIIQKKKGEDKMIEEKATSIRIKMTTKQRLGKYGSYGDSIDTIINHIVDCCENSHDQEHL